MAVSTLNLLDLALKPRTLPVLQVLHLVLKFARQELPHLLAVYPQHFDISLCYDRIGQRILSIGANLLTDPDDRRKRAKVVVKWR